MAQGLWYNKIDRSVDWGGDASTNNLPVAGSVVQDFIKSELNEKIGVIYHDDVLGMYLCFSHVDDRDEFLNDRTKDYLIKGTFLAPSSYKAKIITEFNYKAVLINSVDNILTFDYVITNNDEIFTENIRYTVTVTKNGKSTLLNGTGIYGKPISINLDSFFNVEGTTEVSIMIVGQTSNVVATSIVTYEVVNLVFDSYYDVSKVYDLTKAEIDPLVINYSIFGSSNLKYIE